jgi:imidazolonepropionase-like amidohydrolase
MKKVLSLGGKLLKALLALVLVAVVLVVLSIPLSRFSSPELKIDSKRHERILIENVQLVDVAQNQIIPNQSVLIENGKILALGHSKLLLNEVEQQAIFRVDARGQYLAPGLVDAHVHVFDPQDLGLYLSHGITTVRNMAGMPAHLRWQKDFDDNQAVGSRLVTYSPALNAGDQIGPFHQRVDSPVHGRSLVRQYAEMGYQGIKVYNGLNKKMLDAVIDEASKLNLPVAGHPSSQIDFAQSVNLAMASIEHVEELFQVALKYKATRTSVDQLAETIADSKLPVVTTLVAFDNIYQASEHGNAFKESIEWDYLTGFTAFVGQKQLSPQFEASSNDWESTKTRAHFAITQALFEKGAIVAIGSDTGPALTMPGLSFHRELEILEKLNVHKGDILKAATINSSEVVKVNNLCGEIKVGCLADLILLKDNPLENLSTLVQPQAVFVDGRYLDRQQLINLREQGKAHHSFYVVMGWLIESLFQ